MAKRTFTLFVGDNEIKVLLARGKIIEKWATIPVAPGIINSGVITEEDKLAALLRQQLKTSGIRTKRVTLALNSPEALFRLVNLPQLPLDILPEAVRREAEKVMPVALDEFYLSYQTMPKSRDEMSVLMAIYPRDATDRLVKMVRKAGLVPHFMDLAPIALCRLISEPKAILLSSQTDYLDIAIIADGLPQVIRSLSIPGRSSSLSAKLDAIKEEVERTVAFYNSSHQDAPFGSTVPLVVCGDLLESPDSQQMITDRLGYTVSAPDFPLDAPPEFDKSSYMVNVALATKTIMPRLSAVNFDALPPVYRIKRLSPVKILVETALIAGICGVIVLAWAYANAGPRLETLRSQMDTIQKSIGAQQTQIASLETSINQTQAATKPIEVTANALDARRSAMAGSRADASGDIIEIRKLLPPTARLSSVTLGSTINLDGTAATTSDVYGYARKLRESDRFTACLVASINRVETGNNTVTYNFAIVLN